jgi:hypothetical protein
MRTLEIIQIEQNNVFLRVVGLFIILSMVFFAVIILFFLFFSPSLSLLSILVLQIFRFCFVFHDPLLFLMKLRFDLFNYKIPFQSVSYFEFHFRYIRF